jgi:hypothetical protein
VNKHTSADDDEEGTDTEYLPLILSNSDIDDNGVTSAATSPCQLQSKICNSSSSVYSDNSTDIDIQRPPPHDISKDLDTSAQVFLNMLRTPLHLPIYVCSNDNQITTLQQEQQQLHPLLQLLKQKSTTNMGQILPTITMSTNLTRNSQSTPQSLTSLHLPPSLLPPPPNHQVKNESNDYLSTYKTMMTEPQYILNSCFAINNCYVNTPRRFHHKGILFYGFNSAEEAATDEYMFFKTFMGLPGHWNLTQTFCDTDHLDSDGEDDTNTTITTNSSTSASIGTTTIDSDNANRTGDIISSEIDSLYRDYAQLITNSITSFFSIHLKFLSDIISLGVKLNDSLNEGNLLLTLIGSIFFYACISGR